MSYIKVAMRVPNGKGIFAPSKIQTGRYDAPPEGATAHQALVSFDDDGISNPVPVTIYGRGLDCWYVEDQR